MNRDELIIVLLIILVVIYFSYSKEDFYINPILIPSSPTSTSTIESLDSVIALRYYAGSQLIYENGKMNVGTNGTKFNFDIIYSPNPVYPLKLSSNKEYIYVSENGKSFITSKSNKNYITYNNLYYYLINFYVTDFNTIDLYANNNDKYKIYYDVSNKRFYLVFGSNGNLSWSQNYQDGAIFTVEDNVLNSIQSHLK